MRTPSPSRVQFPLRLHFREDPWDLAVALGYTAFASLVVLALGAGDLFAILLVLLAPGYVLVAALFPGGSEIGWIERLTLSSGASLAEVVLIALLLAITSVGLTLLSLMLSLLGLTGVLGLVAVIRRRRLPADRRLELTLVIQGPRWKDEAGVDRMITVLVVLSVVAAVAAFGYAVLVPHAQERFTEFYLLGPSGNATGLPVNLNVSQAAQIYVGLANHEGSTVAYGVRVDLVGVQVVYNATLGYNVTMELNRTTLGWLNTTLADGGTWTRQYSFSVPAPGRWEIQFLLYDNGVLTKYELHLLLRVT